MVSFLSSWSSGRALTKSGSHRVLIAQDRTQRGHRERPKCAWVAFLCSWSWSLPSDRERRLLSCRRSWQPVSQLKFGQDTSSLSLLKLAPTQNWIDRHLKWWTYLPLLAVLRNAAILAATFCFSNDSLGLGWDNYGGFSALVGGQNVLQLDVASGLLDGIVNRWFVDTGLDSDLVLWRRINHLCVQIDLSLQSYGWGLVKDLHLLSLEIPWGNVQLLVLDCQVVGWDAIIGDQIHRLSQFDGGFGGGLGLVNVRGGRDIIILLIVVWVCWLVANNDILVVGVWNLFGLLLGGRISQT